MSQGQREEIGQTLESTKDIWKFSKRDGGVEV